MKSKTLTIVASLASLVLALMSSWVLAHHSTAGIYNEDVEVEITGVVKQWRFINPHPSLIIEVRATSGELQEWDISYGGSAVTHLVRRGYTADTFTQGEQITARGYASKTTTAHGLLIRGNPTRADGSPAVSSPAPGGRAG